MIHEILNQKVEGIVLRGHCVKDPQSKATASKNLKNWQSLELTPREWIAELEQGHTIQPSTFQPLEDGTFTHALSQWQGTHFVCCDADNVKGVEFLEDGSDKNPHGVDAFTSETGLSDLYPTLREKVFAVGQSVSSMADWKTPEHRRFRLVFLFDELMTSEARYHAILLALAAEFLIIPQVARSPAQPIFGNAREGFNRFSICGNVLKLSDYPISDPQPDPQPTKHSVEDKATDDKLAKILNENNINFDPRPRGGFFVRCPNSKQHTDGICNHTDAYVFVSDSGGYAFHCSHASCQTSGKSTWRGFKEGYNIRNGTQTHTSTTAAPPPVPVRESQDNISLDIPFPTKPLEKTIFGLYEAAYDGKNETCPAYRFAELLCAVGAMLGRSVCFEGAGYALYPNWYIALIGKSYFSKKSLSTMHKMPALLESFERVKVIYSLSSPEGLVTALSDFSQEIDDYPRIVAAIDELKTMFTKSRMKGSEGLISKLTELYGCPQTTDNTTKVDKLVVEKPFFSLMGNSTMAWIQSSVTLDDIGGGFINRFTFFLHEQQDWKPVTEPPNTPELRTMHNILTGVLGTLPARRTFTLSAESLDFFENWYVKTHDRLISEENETEGRITTNMLKLAMILSVFQNGEENNQIELFVLEQAIAVSEYWSKVNKAIFCRLAADRYTEQELRVLKALDDLGGQATKSQISDRIGRRHLSARDLQRIIEALICNETVVTTPQGRGTLLTRQ